MVELISAQRRIEQTQKAMTGIDDINSKVPEFNRVDPNSIDFNSVHEKMNDYNKLYNKFAKYDANHDSFLDKDEIRKAKNSIQYQAENFKDNHFRLYKHW